MKAKIRGYQKSNQQSMSKKLLVLPILLWSITVFGKEVPGPTIWYSISEKILKSGQQLFGADVKIDTKKKVSKTKILKVSGKFQQKDQLIIPDPMALPDPAPKSVWFLPE